jgi:methylmalonyl-CoA mutase cobalamin-binding domain/chain
LPQAQKRVPSALDLFLRIPLEFITIMPDCRRQPEASLIGSMPEAVRDASQLDVIRKEVNRFACQNGRRPRVLACYIGPGGRREILGHIASMFAQWGFDVDIGPACRSARQAALTAVENDVHLVCLVCKHDLYPLTPYQLVDALKEQDGDHIWVAVLGDVPEELHFKDTPGRSRLINVNPKNAGEVIALLEKLV